MPGSHSIPSSPNTRVTPSSFISSTANHSDMTSTDTAQHAEQRQTSMALSNHHAPMQQPCPQESTVPQQPLPTPTSSGTPETANSDPAKPSASSDRTPPRKRTRATPDQLLVLEKAFSVNPSPNSRVREQLSRELGMSERSIQIWFQNRRAKVKNLAKRASPLHDETVRMQYYAATAAAAACQAASHHQQRIAPDGSVIMDPDLYYYYYYYYYNQQQQQRQRQYGISPTGAPESWLPTAAHVTGVEQPVIPPPPLVPQSMPPPPPPPIEHLYGQAAFRPTWHVTATPPPSSIPPSPLGASISDPTSRYHGASRRMFANGAEHIGKTRAHSVGPYPQPYGPRHNYPTMRHASVEAVAMDHAFYRQRNPLPSIPPPPAPWMMNGTTMIPDPLAAFMPNDPNALAQLPITSDMTSVPAAPLWTVQDMPVTMMPSAERLCTPMSMDGTPEEEPTDLLMQAKFSVEALQIGSWKRVVLNTSDLLCHCDTQRRVMTWGIQDGQQRFKMEFSIDIIQQIRLEPMLERLGWARLQLHLAQPEAISFYMEDPKAGWIQCQDFTQDRQATSVALHQLEGPALALRAELHRLARSDAHIQSLMWQQDVQAVDPRLLTMSLGQEREPTPADALVNLVQDENTTTVLPLLDTQKEALDRDTANIAKELQQESQSLLLFQGIEPQG